MNKISFEGIGEVAATFACEAGVQEGQGAVLRRGPCEQRRLCQCAGERSG